MSKESIQKKITEIKKLFSSCKNKEEVYNIILHLGKTLSPYNPEHKTPKCLIEGCQSLVYLHSTFKNNLLHFEAFSDALISAGLASLLLKVYNEEDPETILQTPPTFLQDLDLASQLSPNRASGLYQMYLQIKKEALAHLQKH
jgi:cysteine desulfuration protein SufE